MRTVITGSGCYAPDQIIRNADFSGKQFFEEGGMPVNRNQEEIIAKFQQITGIKERRYAQPGMNTSMLGALAAKEAILSAGIDPETIDQLIVAHNFGEQCMGVSQADLVPSIAARIKHALSIQNPDCVAYDILFGCPGWLQGLIQAHYYSKAGEARNCLVIGADILSRISDPYDRDSMIYSDGAGAVITQVSQEPGNNGIIGVKSASFACEDVNYIYMGKSYHRAGPGDSTSYLKMQGRKVYEFALKYVPAAIKSCLENAGVLLSEVKKIFIHQANEKMDEAIVERLYRLCQLDRIPGDIMPMNIQTYGNSSVATIPTLFDMVVKGKMPEHHLSPGDIIVFASVGAGMNINAVCYRC
ncbi:MAG TPA: ketoacyl-ACP synthase III [Sediminibacterium sp.]|nr:ketoacyl-ACP synthase III [Sediminibacterium sp.]